MTSSITQSHKHSPTHEPQQKKAWVNVPSHPPPPPPAAEPSSDKDQIITNLKNEVRECREQLRSHDRRLVEHLTILSMLLKLINKTPENDVGTSTAVTVHCSFFTSHTLFI